MILHPRRMHVCNMHEPYFMFEIMDKLWQWHSHSLAYQIPFIHRSFSLWISYFLKIAFTVSRSLILSVDENKRKYLVFSEFLLLFTVSRHTNTLLLILGFVLLFACRIACFANISSHIIYLLHLFCLCRENSWCVSLKVSAFRVGSEKRATNKPTEIQILIYFPARKSKL